MRIKTKLSLLFLLLTQIMLAQVSQKTAHYTHYHRGSAQDVQPQTKAGFALMGGSTDQDAAFQWMAEHGGGGDFLVLRGSGADGYQAYIDEIADVNSVDTIVLHNREAALDPFVLDKVAKAEAIFFAGGDQWNYVGKWKDTPLQNELNDAIARGVPIGGTSAGLAILGEHVFSAEKGGVTPQDALDNPYREDITLESDFLHAAPLQGLITDTHFSERDRMGRLVSFMARLQMDRELSSIKGIGVDEKTAVLVEADGSSKVVGEGAAHFVKAQGKPEVCEPGTALTHTQLDVHSVRRDQGFNLSTWTSPDVKATPLQVEQGQLK